MTKLLIVDDEEFIRDGIALKLERLAPHIHIIGKAEDASQAMDILKAECPDIILTDIRMPEIDGLQFVENVKSLFPDIKFIVISGYQDFEFAKRSIILGVEDYLLKPIKNTELIEVIEKIEAKIKLEQINKQHFIELKARERSNLKTLRNKHFTDIVENINSIETSSMLCLLERIDIKFEQPYFSAITILLSGLGNIAKSNSLDDIALVKFAVMNIAEEILSGLGKAVAFEYLKKENHIVVIVNSSKLTAETVFKVCKELQSSLDRYLRLETTIGIGNLCNNLCYIHSSYSESYSAASQKIILGNNKVIHFNDVPNSNLITYFLSENQKQLLTNFINSQNSEGAFEIIDDVFSIITSKGISFVNLKALCIDISILLGKILKECGGSWEDVFQEDIFSENYLSDFKELDDLRSWMKECIKSIFTYLNELRKSGGKKVIDEIKKYIENYYYTNINLKELSGKYFLNFSYLSQLFKSETGEKFVDYLTRVRIDKAKTLLISSTLKTYEIAEMVGYSDPRYFSDVFTRNIGMSPSKYREHSYS